MLQSIEIKNFRCFHETKIEGFKRINLITGKNNGGKTALLEAIYLVCSGNLEGIQTQSRNASQDKDRFKSLFLNYDSTLIVDIDTVTEKNQNIGIQLKAGNFQNTTSRPITHNIHLVLDKDKQVPSTNIISQYDNASIDGKDIILEQSLQIIDSKIHKIRTFSSKPNILFLQEQGETTWQPIYYYGDAIQKIVRYVATITSFDPMNEGNVLLLDEIENGIHYTAQAEIWRMLYQLAKKFNVQIFATTHSQEMIKAFAQAAEQHDFVDETTYFEMTRHAKTNEIIGIRHELGVLEYELESNANVRGE